MKDIRIAELEFHIRFCASGRLSKNKSSGLRGGIGRKLIRLFCIDDKCQIQNEKQNGRCKCEYADECIAQRFMYAAFDLPCQGVNGDTSEGYMVICRDSDEYVSAGEEMIFRIILLGKTVVLFNPVLMAVYELGQEGLGEERIPFTVNEVKNERGESILSGSTICKEYYRINRMEDIFRDRFKKLQDIEELTIDLLTPVSIKRGGVILKADELEIMALLAAADFRYYSIKCYEGIPAERPKAIPDYADKIWVLESNLRPTSGKRHSGRKDQMIPLKGVKGRLRISLKDCTPEDREKILSTLIRGEILHVGSHTSIGYGKYVMHSFVLGDRREEE